MVPRGLAARPARRGRVFYRRLTRLDRFWWAVGSPVRLLGLAAVTVVLMYLGYVSIGVSAVYTLAVLIGFLHLVPYMWSGRLVMVIDDRGVHDCRRFRRRTYLWSDGFELAENELRPNQFRGLVMLPEDEAAESQIVLSSWCKSRDDLDNLIDSIETLGFPVLRFAEGGDREDEEQS